jgi:hypothetical protein
MMDYSGLDTKTISSHNHRLNLDLPRPWGKCTFVRNNQLSTVVSSSCVLNLPITVVVQAKFVGIPPSKFQKE